MVDAEEEMSSDDLTIIGDYSDYNILEEEKNTIFEKDDVLVKAKKDTERKSTVNFLQKKKEDSEYLKIKWTNSRKEERILINNVSLNYSKKRVSVPTQQYSNGAYMEETVHDLTTKTRQRKKSMTCTNKEEV